MVIPLHLRHILFSSLHYEHPGWDSLLATVSNLWWPCLHREIIVFQISENDLIPSTETPNDQIALAFPGPFASSVRDPCYLLVSAIHFSRWPELEIFSLPTIANVLEFLRIYIAFHGIPKGIRKYPGTVFTSIQLQQFCEKRCIKHVLYPVSDHKENWKVERLIRNVKERLRTNRNFLLERYSSVLAELPYHH